MGQKGEAMAERWGDNRAVSSGVRRVEQMYLDAVRMLEDLEVRYEKMGALVEVGRKSVRMLAECLQEIKKEEGNDDAC